MFPFRILYQTIEFKEFDIHLRCLRDKNQFSDPFGEAEALGISDAQWSLFGVVWESSRILADKMQDFDIQGKRILEVGCGIGLSSLLLNARHADITATDYHPEAGNFLAKNTDLNHGKAIPFLRTGWHDQHNQLGTFDVIIGSDLLYEQNHIALLSEFIEQHAEDECEVIIVDPGRGNHAKFSKKMIELGFSHQQYKPEPNDDAPAFKGVVLTYLRKKKHK
ncbi:methyltransferase [Thiomicrorhabdus sp. 6S3-12]|uniref:class I SAM-dependent methyltransferase n=1 Tax=Thiomicrorhabdus sp. 6S3-12 TaxID=2819681 RepID=UPI001AAC7BD6|nr:methyltransferase domain-containing protein [Thiomicrorhabdus sp. 6S3-12]MBO1924380.1 class I SAM-dependent methyltransferase [Thiomicrorhabdus sp. 6S3-12]